MLAHVYGESTLQNDAIKHQNLLPTPQSANFPHATAIDWGYIPFSTLNIGTNTVTGVDSFYDYDLTFFKSRKR